MFRRGAKSKIAANRLPRFARVGLYFYDRPKFSALLWLSIVVFGIASYTTLLKREGFPPVNIPYSMVNGGYIVNDAAKVDQDVSKPISEIISKKVDKVKNVQATAGANFYSVIIQYKDGVDANKANAQAEKAVKDANILPQTATAEFQAVSPKIDNRGDDILIAFYSRDNSQSTQTLAAKASQAASYLKNQVGIPLAKNVSINDPFAHGTDPVTGQPALSQKIFDRFSIRDANGNSHFYSAVDIGVQGVKGFDVLELDKQVRGALGKLNAAPQFAGYAAQVSYSAAPDINDQINGLQHSLLDGLVAILIVSGLLIALRASLITVSAMIVVLLTTLGVLYVIGYSLNTITLFSLILCLSLIVDDTIIMVEAVDAQRRRSKEARETIKKSLTKISRAMIAATLTATIGFAPLIFVGGILGSFIRAIPITVITSLIVSLLVALTFIPFLSRFLLLRPKQLGHAEDHESPAHHTEAFIAKTLSRPLLWAQHHRRREVGLGVAALIIGFGFIIAGGFLFSKVTFNLFAPSKDSDNLAVALYFDPNQDIAQTQALTAQADKIVAGQLGQNFKQASYYDMADNHTALLTVNLKSLKKRSITAPQMADQLNKVFKTFKGAQVKVSSEGVGPPGSNFTARIETPDRDKAYKLAGDLAAYLRTAHLKRLNGTTAHLKDVTISSPDSLLRFNSKTYIDVTADFDADDTTTLVTLAQNAVKDKYNSKKLAGYGLKSSNLVFDLGTEEDFQQSFKAMVIAFPILLIAIFILMAFQFRSLLQPLLIFMAIPFSLFGIMGGLWLTHNAFSFFTTLGFFALLGLSIKNTILLTDYANQARRAGSGPVEAVAISLQERFRPLIATSITAIVSLIPLYLSNPFWEGLTVTLMFGLLSSTFLVVMVFPYYYLGAEYLRLRISRKAFFKWLGINVVVVAVAVFAAKKTGAGFSAFALLNILLIVYKIVRRRTARRKIT